jgi:hypothetical protein
MIGTKHQCKSIIAVAGGKPLYTHTQCTHPWLPDAISLAYDASTGLAAVQSWDLGTAHQCLAALKRMVDQGEGRSYSRPPKAEDGSNEGARSVREYAGEGCDSEIIRTWQGVVVM